MEKFTILHQTIDLHGKKPHLDGKCKVYTMALLKLKNKKQDTCITAY